jgi:Tfp pilus assembly protein PilN
MASTPKPSDICIGFTVEGGLLKLATVGRIGQKLNVMDQASLPLPVKQFATAKVEDEHGEGRAGDPFSDMGGGETETAESVDYGPVREFLQAHYVPRSVLALGMEEPYVRTLILQAGAKEPLQKLAKRALEEISSTLNAPLPRANLEVQRIGPASALALARLEDSGLLDVFTENPTNPKRPTRIAFLTSNDIALINLVRSHFRVDEREVVHVIHVSEDTTRFIVMRGRIVEYIAPPIQQGASDAHLVSTLYNRIELTAESAGYLSADHVVLSGQAEDIGLKEEILENSPNVIFHSLKRLRIGHSEDEAILGAMHDYILPISVACQQLQPKSDLFYRMNVLPERIREGQKIFKLAWHGVVLLALLFLVAAGLTMLSLQRLSEASALTRTVDYERAQVEEQKAIIAQIDALEQRSAAILEATNTLDTLLVNSELWSETLDTLAQAARGNGDTWVSEMKIEKDGGTTVSGYALSRASIPSFSTAIGTSALREVSVTKIGEKRLFKYDIRLDTDSLYPYAGSRTALWHDSVGVALGDVSTRLAKAQESTSAKPEQPNRPKLRPKKPAKK